MPKETPTFKKQNSHNNQTTMQQQKFKVTGIFLDLDGTLVDSTSAYIEAAKIAFRAVGLAAAPTEVLLELPKRVEQGRCIEDITQGTTDEFLPVYLEERLHFWRRSNPSVAPSGRHVLPYRVAVGVLCPSNHQHRGIFAFTPPNKATVIQQNRS